MKSIPQPILPDVPEITSSSRVIDSASRKNSVDFALPVPASPEVAVALSTSAAPSKAVTVRLSLLSISIPNSRTLVTGGSKSMAMSFSSNWSFPMTGSVSPRMPEDIGLSAPEPLKATVGAPSSAMIGSSESSPIIENVAPHVPAYCVLISVPSSNSSKSIRNSSDCPLAADVIASTPPNAARAATPNNLLLESLNNRATNHAFHRIRRRA